MKKSYGWFPFLDKIGQVVFFLRGFFGRKQTANASGSVKMAPEEIAAWTEPRKLKHWLNQQQNFIKLNGGNGRILMVFKKEEGFKFVENNNLHFSETYTKEQALEVLDELKWWIENN